jgi:hypothetical protein
MPRLYPPEALFSTETFVTCKVPGWVEESEAVMRFAVQVLINVNLIGTLYWRDIPPMIPLSNTSLTRQKRHGAMSLVEDEAWTPHVSQGATDFLIFRHVTNIYRSDEPENPSQTARSILSSTSNSNRNAIKERIKRLVPKLPSLPELLTARQDAPPVRP